MSRVVAIWNPASGSAPDEDELRAALGDEVELVPTTEHDHGAGQTTDALRNGAEIVAVCGGDGTVQSCLAPLANAAATLSVVPLGTGNLLASNLGIPAGLDDVEVTGGATMSIDVGVVNGETFAVMAGSGFDALMIRDANDTLKSRLGTVAYVFSALRHLREQLVTTSVVVDGTPWFSGRTSMVLVGNFGTISGGVEVFPDAEPDDGLLDIAVVQTRNLRDWARLAWHMVRGRTFDLDIAKRAQGKSFSIVHARPRAYELDGEIREPTTRLEAEVNAGSLDVHHRLEDDS